MEEEKDSEELANSNRLLKPVGVQNRIESLDALFGLLAVPLRKQPPRFFLIAGFLCLLVYNFEKQRLLHWNPLAKQHRMEESAEVVQRWHSAFEHGDFPDVLATNTEFFLRQDYDYQFILWVRKLGT